MKPLKIIFITLVAIDDINDRNLYADLMRYFVKQGHKVTIISPAERRTGIQSHLKKDAGVSILRIKSLNIQKANIIEKVLGTFSVDFLIKSAIKKYLKGEKFDLAIYSTPPITLVNTIKYLRKQNFLKTYLLLKDIFPQNAVDLGFMKQGSFLYKYFRKKETILYGLSDRIGCMSQANIDYVINHNPEIDANKVELCPNSVEVQTLPATLHNSSILKKELGISEHQRVFIYGGNLGKPQGIDFLIEVLKSQQNNKKAFFIIIGSGTEFGKIKKWYDLENRPNILLRNYMPKIEYNKIVQIADVGMIFLDYKFKIPNYPSRLLAYLENKKPVLAVTDKNTDIGSNAEKRGYGKWSFSNDLAATNEAIDYFCNLKNEKLQSMGEIGYEFLIENYSVQNTYHTIIRSLTSLD